MTPLPTRPAKTGPSNRRKLPARLVPLALAAAALLAGSAFSLHAAAQTGAAADSSGNAVERQSLEQLRATTLALIEALVSQGLLPRDRADAILRQAAAPASAGWGEPPRMAPAAGAAAGNLATAGAVVRVPYLSESVRAQLREELKNEVLATAREERWADPRALPDWVRGLVLEGDLRVRWQEEGLRAPVYATGFVPGVGNPCNTVGGNLPAECYRSQSGSPAWSPDLTNTTHDRNRLTLRARLGVLAKVGDDTSLGLRLSTGSTSGPTSASQTLGQGFNKVGIVLDRAWLRWEPRYDLRAWAGRMPTPFFGGDLLWPDDLNLDGVALQGEHNLGNGAFVFGSAGAFALGEVALGARDKWLYGAQIGVDWSSGGDWQWRSALAVYDFHNMEGIRETALPPTGGRDGSTDYLSSDYPATVRLKGNSLIALNAPGSTASATTWGLASKFRPINLSSAFTLKQFAPVEATLALDWVKNSAFDLADISRRAGVPLDGQLNDRSTGLQAKLTLGAHRLAQAGDWQATVALRRFERDAWVDGFTDTNWHLGGTSYQGWSLGGQYAIDRRTWLGLRLIGTRNLDDGLRDSAGRANLSSAPLRIDLLQLDLNARF
jgi:hypothetical protein